jgi:hypothetical protein
VQIASSIFIDVSLNCRQSRGWHPHPSSHITHTHRNARMSYSAWNPLMGVLQPDSSLFTIPFDQFTEYPHLTGWMTKLRGNWLTDQSTNRLIPRSTDGHWTLRWSEKYSCFVFGRYRVQISVRRPASLRFSSFSPGRYLDSSLNLATTVYFHILFQFIDN